MRTIRRTIQLHRQQYEFRHSPALYRAFVGGRGAGKSFAGIYDLIRRAKRGRTYTVADPTSIMSRDDTFPRFQKLARQLGVWGDVRLTPYPDVTLTTGALIRFRTAEDPEKMRGPDLSGVLLNEASLMPRMAYDISIATLREGGEQGWLSACFTPRGPSHWSFEVFATGRPNTALFRAKTRDNPFNPPDFQATLQEQYGNTPFAKQELEGEFVQPEGAVFPHEWLSWPGFVVGAVPENVTHSVLYLDPSWGKALGKGDDQAFVLAHFWPGPRHENLIYLECIAVKEDIIAMCSRAVRLCRDRKILNLSYEVNGTMGLLDAEMRRQLQEATMPHVRTMPVENKTNKIERVTNAFMPYLKNKQIRIVDSPGGQLLRAQLSDTPWAVRDDCADAGAGAILEIERLLSGR